MVDLAQLRAVIQAAYPERLKAIMPRVLLLTAILLWAVGVWQGQLRIGPYGLVHSLPPLFFVAMLLLNGSFLATLRWNQEHTILLSAELLVLVAFVDLMPIILERTPRFPYVYDSYGYADYIVRNGHLNLGYPYHNWPALHLLNAVLVQVSGIDPVSLLLWSPLLLRGLTLPVFGLIFRQLCDSKGELWVALWLSVLFAVGPGYLVPGKLAALLMTVILSLALIPVLGSHLSVGQRLSYQLLLVILLVALPSAHLLTSVAAVVSLTLAYALAKFVARGAVRLNTIVLAAVFAACWIFYVAVEVTFTLLPIFVAEILDLDAVLTQTRKAAMGGSQQHTIVFLVRFAYVVTLSLLAVSAFLKHIALERRMRLQWALPAAWVVSSVSLVLLTAYSGEILGRAFAFAFLALVVLAAKHVTGLGFWPLACLVLLASALYPVNAWGNERVDYVPPSEIAATEVFYDHRPSNYWITAYPIRIWRYRYLDESRHSDADSSCFAVVGMPSEQQESFLEGSAEASRSLRDQMAHSSQVYDSRTIQILLQRGDHQR